jgi:hypothetical protein
VLLMYFQAKAFVSPGAADNTPETSSRYDEGQAESSTYSGLPGAFVPADAGDAARFDSAVQCLINCRAACSSPLAMRRRLTVEPLVKVD